MPPVAKTAPKLLRADELHAETQAEEPFATERDLEQLLAAMRPECQNAEESRSLDGSIPEGRKVIDVRLCNQSFFIPFTSVKAARKKGSQGWQTLAGGAMEALREQHSLLPKRFFELSEVYEEALRAVMRIAREGMTPKEIDELQVLVLERQSGLRDRTAITKATVNAYVEKITALLRAGIGSING